LQPQKSAIKLLSDLRNLLELDLGNQSSRAQNEYPPNRNGYGHPSALAVGQ
jgi:hypothetical protein